MLLDIYFSTLITISLYFHFVIYKIVNLDLDACKLEYVQAFEDFFTSKITFVLYHYILISLVFIAVSIEQLVTAIVYLLHFVVLHVTARNSGLSMASKTTSQYLFTLRFHLFIIYIALAITSTMLADYFL